MFDDEEEEFDQSDLDDQEAERQEDLREWVEEIRYNSQRYI